MLGWNFPCYTGIGLNYLLNWDEKNFVKCKTQKCKTILYSVLQVRLLNYEWCVKRLRKQKIPRVITYTLPIFFLLNFSFQNFDFLSFPNQRSQKTFHIHYFRICSILQTPVCVMCYTTHFNDLVSKSIKTIARSMC